MLDKNDPLVKRLIADEGWRDGPYRDQFGFWTIGVGHLIDSRKNGRLPDQMRSFPLTEEQILWMLEEDIKEKEDGLLARLPWYVDLDTARRHVLTSMAFQMGVDGLLRFEDTLRAVREKRWSDAADGMRASLWYRQTPARAERLARVMETGKEEV